MEVTLKTEVEAGASGFSVMGGGNEGIFIKKVLRESPASKIFSLREGDQLLSATIFFDNIKYEDALKILQYSEPYRVQFSLKRKIAGKEELEDIHSTAQSKKERTSQEKEFSESIPEETPHVSGKAMSEEDRETLIVSQRVGRSKRPKKDRLSWPKFQSIKSKKILGHRRSHSTSDAYEAAVQDISPTSTDTESQFQQEVHIKEKKRSQKKLKFPSIGFKMHRSKPETQDMQKKEIKTTLLSERAEVHKEDIRLENNEILAVECTTSSSYEIKPGEVHETLTKDIKDMRNGIPSHAQKCPEVEISIKKEEDKESTSKYNIPEAPASSKSRKKKQKEAAGKKEVESGINIEKTGLTAQGSIQVKGLEIGTAKEELHAVSDTVETGKKLTEEEKQILKNQKTKFGISMIKKKELEAENTQLGSDVPHSEAKPDKGLADGKIFDVKFEIADAEPEISTWKIQIPSFKKDQIPKDTMKKGKEESPEEAVNIIKKEHREDGMPTTDKIVRSDIDMITTENYIEGKESKFKLPKFKLPTFTWSTSKDEMGQNEKKIRDTEGKTSHLQEEKKEEEPSTKEEIKITAEDDIALPVAEIPAPSMEVTVEGAAEGDGEKGRFKMPDVKMPSVKLPKVKGPHVQVSLPKAEVSLPKAQVEVQGGEVALQGPDAEGGLEAPAGKVEGGSGGMKLHMPKVKVPSVVFSKPTVKAPKLDADISPQKVDASLPEADLKAGAGDISIAAPDVKLPSVEGSLELQAPAIDLKVPSAEGALEGAQVEGAGLKGKFKMPKFDKPKFGVSPPKAEGLEGEVSLPTAGVDVPSATVTAAGEGPALGLKADVPGAKIEGAGWKVEKPSLKMPKVDIKAPKVDISMPSADVTLPKASADLQAPEVSLALEGEAKAPEKEATKSKDGKFKMPKFGMPSFGWSSSREAKGTVAAEVDVSLKEPQVTAPSGTAEVDVTLPAAEIQAPGVEVVIDSCSGKEDDMGKTKSSLFRMPKVSLSKISKPHFQSKSGFEVSSSDNLCYAVTEETPVVFSGSAQSEIVPEIKGDSRSKGTRFRIPSLGFSRVDTGSSKISVESSLPKGDITLTKYHTRVPESESKMSSSADENLSITDFEILNIEGSYEQGDLKPGVKLPDPDISLGNAEFTVKIPKFQKPKFVYSWSKGKPAESCIGSEVGNITSDSTEIDIETPIQIPDAELGTKMPMSSTESTLDALKLDVSLPSVESNVPELEVKVHSTNLECQAEQEGAPGEKDTDGKENKFKTSKFKLPSFSWSPKKAAIVPSATEGQLEEPILSTLSGRTESELTFPAAENQYLQLELDTSTEKDGEKGKTKKSQFTMPKISFPKTKGQKIQVCLPVQETDICDLKQEKEGVTVQKSEKGAGVTKIPKVPTVEFSKPDVKSPKAEVDISMPRGEVRLPSVCEDSDLTLKSVAANASLSTSDVKITDGSFELKSPDTSVEKTVSEITVGDVEIKIEGPEGKTKMSKFQMPKFGSVHSKGKGSEKEVSQPKSEGKVPQLKATVEIADIAVESPNLDVESGMGKETYSAKVKTMKSDNQASEAYVCPPSTDISTQKPAGDIQGSDAALQIKGEIKRDGDGEEKEGHFKMPKFKLPSFSWSPKKEGSVKSGSVTNLEDHKPAVTSDRMDTEVRGIAADDQGSGPALDLEIATGKVEHRSPTKKPQFVMPKISLSKIKVPKSQTHSPKVEVDAAIPKTEGEGDDSIQIPDIEKSHSERTGEGAQISIKLSDVKTPPLEFSKTETAASKTDMGVRSSKTDAALPASKGSFQQVLKPSPTNEDAIQNKDINLPREASVELRSPEIVTERSLVVDGRKIKLEGPEGKIKMPKFQKPKFGISLTKGKVVETEITSPKIEAELPQLKMTDEIADIAVGVPASELASDVLDPEISVYDCNIKTPQVLVAGTKAPKVDVSPQSASKPVTEGIIESLKEKEINLKEEREIKTEEIQIEEHQGWFKMPKFRIPAFGRTPLKEKRGDADTERSMEKTQTGIPSAEVQTERSIPENTFSLPHAVAEITIGKEGISKLEDSVRSSDVSLPKVKGDISLSTGKTAEGRVTIKKTETYADIVKHSAEGQKIHTSEFTVSSAELSKSYLSPSETDKDNSFMNMFPAGTLTLEEHKVKSQDMDVSKVKSSIKLETSGVGCKPSSAEITLDATQKKTDVSLPKEEVDVQNQEAVTKEGKIKGEMKITGKDSRGSQLKRPVCDWSTAVGSEDGAYVRAKMEDVKVEVPEVKTDVKIARVDPEIKFQVKKVEQDMSAAVEVQVEDRAETSKIKTYKFKIPKFGVLHSEAKGLDDYVSLSKSEADSETKVELSTAETQFQKPEECTGTRSPALDHMEASSRITVQTVDKSQDGPEVNIKIPKLKIPRFTFKALPTEADVSVSKIVTDPKGSSTDVEVVHLQGSSAVSEETPGAPGGGIQKAKSKILTLTDPDIKTAHMTTTITSSLSNAGQDIHWSYAEGQEVSEEVKPEHVAIERCEIYTTEILKESEILSPEVKTATLGFSLLKVKLPESHSNLEVLVQQPSPTEDASVSKPKCADESFRVAAQGTGSAELKPYDKPDSETEASSGEVSLPKLKTFAVEVKPSIKSDKSHLDKSAEGINADPLSKDENVVEALEDEEKDNEKEKTDSKRSGRFKFWLPSIGFSSGEEISIDSKTEVKKSVPEDVKPADTTEKTGWFRFPKLGFTSPSKKAKAVDKEEMDPKEGTVSDEDSPSDKPDVFFDAQETLSPKGTTEDGKFEVYQFSSNVAVSRTIVTSSARTELILLEEQKDSQSDTPGDTTK